MTLKLSDFQTIRELGSGSFGCVRLVRKRDDNQVWAIKTVSMGRLSQKQKENALNEVRLLASIEIQNVIAYKACFFDQDSNSLCIAMEYADGGDLQSQIQALKDQSKSETFFEEKYIWKVAYQILQGLKILHCHKIIHRDIKSANIFFVDGIAKLGDLNVSKVAEQGLCQTQTGTPYYTSPQIWQGRKYGNKCDIWSLGVLLYQMCCLRMPFVARDFPTLYRKVVDGSYEEIPQRYSEELKNLVRMCLVVEQEMRPSAQQLLQTAVLHGMEASLNSFNLEEGQIKLIDPIKCPKVLRFLAVKLPKPRGEEQRRGVTFNQSTKKQGQEGSFKIKSIKKIRSEKVIQLDEGVTEKPAQTKLNKCGSRKLICLEQDQGKKESCKLQKSASKKIIKLPPIENESRLLQSPVANKIEDKKSLKHISSIRKIICSSTKRMPVDSSEEKQN